MQMIHTQKPNNLMDPKQVLALILIMILFSAFYPVFQASGEAMIVEDDEADAYISPEDWGDSFVILDDPELFDYEATLQEMPVITSEGKTNVKVHGVKSKGKLVRYTIPKELLWADPDFLALMIEAEKYIGYPYVYGESNPDTGFDCSGFVCWVFNHSGVYKMPRYGATGLYGLCKDIPREEARPGDLVFFEKTMGSSVKGITHVGIYVGNNMMIHAGDPVGFADLKSDKWRNKIYAFGRLPID